MCTIQTVATNFIEGIEMTLAVTITKTGVRTTYVGQDQWTQAMTYISDLTNQGIAFTAVFA